MSGRARHFVPRLMRAPDAAYYLGMSESRFRRLVKEGKITGRREIDEEERYVAWDVTALDSFADSLAREADGSSDWKDQAA